MPSPVESRRSESESSPSPHVSSPSPDVKDSSPSPARSGLESDSSPSPRTRVPISAIYPVVSLHSGIVGATWTKVPKITAVLSLVGRITFWVPILVADRF